MKLAEMHLSGVDLKISTFEVPIEDIASETWTEKNLVSRTHHVLRNKKKEKSLLLTIGAHLKADFVQIKGDIQTRAPMVAKDCGYHAIVHIRVNSKKTCSIYRDFLWAKDFEEVDTLFDKNSLEYGFSMRKTFSYEKSKSLREALLDVLKGFQGYTPPSYAYVSFADKAVNQFSEVELLFTKGIHPIISQ